MPRKFRKRKPIFIGIMAVIVVIVGFGVVGGLKSSSPISPDTKRVLGEKDLKIAQAASFFDCANPTYASSPVCKGEHPRIHITQDTLPYFQNKIATYYKPEYQSFVNWVDANFLVEDSPDKSGLMADYHALIYLIGPINGITYGHSMTDYRDRAIGNMLWAVANWTGIGKARDYRFDGYEIVARAYDWVWADIVPADRTKIVNWLAEIGTSSLNSMKSDPPWLFSSAYFEGFHPWYWGLAFYGDGIRDADAQTLVNGFDTWMLNGKWLDAQNWVARNNGGVSEYGNYILGHPVSHVINIDGWRTATGENYFAQGTSVAGPDFIKNHPKLILYTIKPFGKANSKATGGADWKMIKVGQSGAGTGIGGPKVMISLGEVLKAVDPDMAALNRWLIDNRVGERVDQWNSKWHFILYFLFGDRSVAPRSPADLGLPTDQFFEGFGMAVMRTGFDSLNDTTLLVLAPPYNLQGHSWDEWTGIPTGFTVDKYGPLAIKQMGYIRGDIGHSFRNNFMRFTDPLTTPNAGFPSGVIPQVPKDVRLYTPGSPWDIGGMKRRIFDSNYDYLYMDYTKYYDPARVSLYTRQFAYFKPDSNQESDYIVILDRTQTTRPDIIKRWALNMAYNPQINGQESPVREGKWEYANADQIIISNNVNPDPYNNISHGGHGRLFVKSLLPEQKKIVKVGGPGHEFEDDAGNWVGDLDMPYLKDAGAFYTGTYYTDVVALNQNTQENFLHVLQTADTQNPAQSAAMTPTERIDGDTMVGAYIKDETQGYKVAMFSKTEANQTQATYTISPTSKTIFHLLADLEPNSSYTITQNAALLATKNSSNEGTLSFTSQGASTFQILKVGEVANVPPVIASVLANPTGGTAPLVVAFSASTSDPDGSISSYLWNFGDGQTGTQQNPSHTYTTAGTFTATLTVTDNRGATAQKSVSITVTAGAPPPPPLKPDITLTKSADKTSAQTGDTITYTITYQNIGQGDAINVVITDPIPEGTTYVTESATSNGAYDQTKNQLMWTISALAPNAKGSVSFGVRVE